MDVIYNLLSISDARVKYRDAKSFERDLVRLVRRSAAVQAAWDELADISNKIMIGIYVEDYWDRFLNHALVVLRIVREHGNYGLHICVQDNSRFIHSEDARYESEHLIRFDRTTCTFSSL